MEGSERTVKLQVKEGTRAKSLEDNQQKNVKKASSMKPEKKSGFGYG